jgi:hypothetical protein
VATGEKICAPDCPTTCGLAASTISTCKDSCDIATTKACPATAACLKADLTIEKRAYFDESTNTPGNYTLKTQIDKVSKNQVFVYTIVVKNVGDATASGVVVTDTLTGQKQDMLTFVDIESKCTYTAADKKVSCIDQSFDPDESKTFSFRMKVVEGAVNGDVIKNVAKVTLGNDTKTAEKDLLISTVVACDHVCTTDSECGSSLKCDTTSGKCRNTACLTATTCNCPVAPKKQCSETCSVNSECATGLVCDPTTLMCRKAACLATANCLCITATPTPTAKPTLEPTILPETGILDFPGVAAFGGGLLLAVVGILLAL